MISKAQLKTYRSLHQKKYRDELGLFLAEGEKCVNELRKAFELEALITEEEVGRVAVEQLSSLRTPQGVIAVFRKPSFSPEDGISVNEMNGPSAKRSFSPKDGLILALDSIQDPGNLGTIIRTCDWFGVHDIFCSLDTADCYNPKVVQATMGSLARVRLHYVDLPQWLHSQSTNDQRPTTIYGTLLDGRDMYEVLSNSKAVQQRNGLSAERSISPEDGHAVIIMGNEGNGISPQVRQYITHPVRIPSYPPEAETSESLNVAIATAVILSEFRRP